MSDSQAKWLLISSGRLFGQNEKRDNFDVLKKVTRLKRKFISQVKKLTLALLYNYERDLFYALHQNHP